MQVSKLSRAEILGMVAAVVLVVAVLFLPWYSLSEIDGAPREGDALICGSGETSCTGFETFPILRWLLLAPPSAPFILAWLVVRGNKLSWAPGELTMVVGFTAFVLIAYNGILDLPGDGPAEVGVSKDWGYWVALLAAAGIAAAGIGRSMEEQQGGAGARTAPGSV